MGMHDHILNGDLEFDGQTSQLHDLADVHTDGHGPHFSGRRHPVRQDIAGVADVPAVAKEERGDWLNIELARVLPTVVASDGPPLQGEGADDEVLRKIADQAAGAELKLTLPGKVRGRGREDEGRPDSEDPVTRLRGRDELREGQVAQACVAMEVAGGRLERAMSYKGIIGRVTRFQSLVRPTGSVG